MVSILWQRLVLTIAIVAAGMLFFHAAGDGSGVAVWSLLADGPVAAAITRYALMTIGAVLIAGVASALTTPYGGAFVLGASLCFGAVRGGSIDPWLRGIESTSAYWTMAAESAIWLVWLVLVVPASWWIGQRIRIVFPASWTPKPLNQSGAEFGTGAAIRSGSYALGSGGGLAVYLAGLFITKASEGTRLIPLWLHSLLGFIVTAAIGASITGVFQSSALPGQAVAVLFIAFLAAAFFGYYLFPAAHPLAILASPIVAGMGWYTLIAVAGLSRQTILQQYFQSPVLFYHAGLISPIYYASAGVAGAAIGIGWSSAVIHGDEEIDAQADGDSAAA